MFSFKNRQKNVERYFIVVCKSVMRIQFHSFLAKEQKTIDPNPEKIKRCFTISETKSVEKL